MFQTIANDGVRMPPQLVAGTENADGTFTAAPAPKGKRVVSPEVAKQVREMLEGVVGKEGTAPEAKIPGYRVAGKTGTADRYDDKTGGYSGKTASFIGFAPADNAELVIGVTAAAAGQELLRWCGRRPGVPRRDDLRAAGAEDPPDRRHHAAHHQAEDHGPVISPW